LEVEDAADVISLCDPVNGFGALQFSFYTVHNASLLDLKEELRDYLEIGHENSGLTAKDNLAYCDAMTSTDKFWRYWLLRKKDSMVFITYSCLKKDADKEVSIVDYIIGEIS
jgi:hypothetical protein